MARQLEVWRSTVGQKAIAAVSGGLLWGWLVLHVLGNLSAFSGEAAMDRYAAALRATGPLLWLVRALLLAALVAHVAVTVALARRARAARPVGYAVVRRRASTVAARAMRWGGVLLLCFIVFHVLHMTFGVLHPSFVPGRVYANLVSGLTRGGMAVLYTAAAGLVALHLLHGLWAALRSLGIAQASAGRLRRPVIAGLAAAMFLGFAAVPVAIALGVVR